MDVFYVDGFAFSKKEEYNLALREHRNIQSIKTKMNMQNKDSVLNVYNKLAGKGILITPVGLSFMRELREILLVQFGMEETELAMIKVVDSSSQAKTKEQFTLEQVVKDNQKKAGTIRTLKIFLAGMIIVIIGMFAINMFLPNSGYINTENKILNQYSSWEEELKQREAAVKEKEEALGIDASDDKE